MGGSNFKAPWKTLYYTGILHNYSKQRTQRVKVNKPRDELTEAYLPDWGQPSNLSRGVAKNCQKCFELMRFHWFRYVTRIPTIHRYTAEGSNRYRYQYRYQDWLIGRILHISQIVGDIRGWTHNSLLFTWDELVILYITLFRFLCPEWPNCMLTNVSVLHSVLCVLYLIV